MSIKTSRSFLMLYIFKFLLISFIYFCDENIHMPQHSYRGQSAICRVQFPPTSKWDQGVELNSSGLTTSQASFTTLKIQQQTVFFMLLSNKALIFNLLITGVTDILSNDI